MADPIDFYFDFSSPYAYLTVFRVDALAARHGRSVNWRPYLLGIAARTTGIPPLAEIPMINDYTARDVPRCARALNVPFAWPTPFPVAAVAASRAYYWLHDRDPDQAKAVAVGLFSAYFAEGRDIGAPEVVVDVAAFAGVDRASLTDALASAPVKERLRRETEQAVARGVFGSPFFIVDGESFWGSDRMEQMERWLASGGW